MAYALSVHFHLMLNAWHYNNSQNLQKHWPIIKDRKRRPRRSLTISSMFLVLEWHMVTVALEALRRSDIGAPTILLLPRTATLLPSTSTPDKYHWKNTITSLHFTLLFVLPTLEILYSVCNLLCMKRIKT